MAEPGATNSEITASRPPYRFTPSGEPNQGDVGLWHDSDEPITAGHVRSLGSSGQGPD